MTGSPPTVRRRVIRLEAIGRWDGPALFAFIGRRAIDGVEGLAPDGSLGRVLSIDDAPVLVSISPPTADALHPAPITVEIVDASTVPESRIVTAAGAAVRHVLDLATDGLEVDEHLGGDPLLGASVRDRPGRRSPGSFDAEEVLTRAILGQQVSVARARDLLVTLAEEHGPPLPRPLLDDPIARACGLRRRFPGPGIIADLDPTGLPMPRTRSRALVTASRAVADGDIALDFDADPAAVRAALLEIHGIGPWTADYVALRGLGEPDVFLPTDLGVIRGLRRLGVDVGTRGIDDLARTWAPWRSYALHHLWAIG